MAIGRDVPQTRTLQGTLAYLNRQNYSFPPDHGARIVGPAHAAGAAGMIGTFRMFTDHRVKILVRLGLGARLQFLAAIGGKGLLPKDFARQADAAAEILPVFLRAHVVEEDARRVLIGDEQRKALGRGQQDMRRVGALAAAARDGRCARTPSAGSHNSI